MFECSGEEVGDRIRSLAPQCQELLATWTQEARESDIDLGRDPNHPVMAWYDEIDACLDEFRFLSVSCLEGFREFVKAKVDLLGDFVKLIEWDQVDDIQFQTAISTLKIARILIG